MDFIGGLYPDDLSIKLTSLIIQHFRSHTGKWPILHSVTTFFFAAFARQRGEVRAAERDRNRAANFPGNGLPPRQEHYPPRFEIKQHLFARWQVSNCVLLCYTVWKLQIVRQCNLWCLVNVNVLTNVLLQLHREDRWLWSCHGEVTMVLVWSTGSTTYRLHSLDGPGGEKIIIIIIMAAVEKL